ncbi:MAG: sugar ABC transporter permease [Chloroflexi bacterium]|nr:sugar ABC transporter permease [Chloroflexota bacterium]MCI0574772.1 sugar ABC transporter permease [Chloroflexota bacterium]MCI0646411.1 sugar ABC transporter permease [Chloroflexota bacterium]MCI0725512.1 sugar ABC transporter permease [Chloroflexota bacterium]
MSSTLSVKELRSSKKRQKRLGIALRLLLAVFLILFSIFPVLWIVSASLNPSDSLSTQRLIPANASLSNYRELLTSPTFPFTTWLWNSIKIASTTTILSVSITTLAAYAFSRFRFSQRNNLLRAILLIQVFPSLLAIVAVFLLISEIGSVVPRFGLDTHAGLILVYLGGAMGINIWLMKGFFDSIPRDIDESAMVDGASHWQIFTRLLLPLMRPILVVIAILSFIGTYGDFIMARILLKSTEQYTLMVGLFIFTSNQFAQQWGVFAAGALLGALPIMIVYILLQDQIVGGLTQGAVKG